MTIRLNATATKTRLEVRNLFMGRASNPGLNAIALSPDNLPRILFNSKVIRESLIEAEIPCGTRMCRQNLVTQVSGLLGTDAL